MGVVDEGHGLVQILAHTLPPDPATDHARVASEYTVLPSRERKKVPAG